MKLSTWAEKQGISYVTAYRWFKQGQIPRVKQMPTGTIIVDDEPVATSQKTCIYCRVSSYDKKDDLDRQAKRCVEFCQNNGWVIEKIIKEVASGMNDKRPKLIKLLKEKPERIVVEHKDRLTRFGFNYFDTMLSLIGCQLVVMNKEQEETKDLMTDMISIITSFCCRLYGLRKGHNKAKKIKTMIKNDTSN